MSASAPAVALHVDEQPIVAAPPASAGRALLRTWEGRIGIGLGLAVLVLIVVGPWLAPYPPDAIGVGPSTAGPSSSHLFGTDNLGRDVLSRFLNGGRSVLFVPVAAVVVSFIIGGGAGMLAAYARGWVDLVVTRAFDLLITLPPLLLVIIVISGAGSSTAVLIATVAAVFVPRVGRVVRGATQSVVTSDYVAAAQARGERTASILVRELLPNVAAPAIADFALRITYAVIFVATLSFLGLGAQPPSSDWGVMVASYRTFLPTQPWATFLPAIGIALISISFNLIADAITRHITRERSDEPVPL
ncbi:MAG: peptide/nickel transport system permease protein [Gaiellales bacterium]|nr:peptide/nickel transport system permease protein [Gaiellales bacterium]